MSTVPGAWNRLTPFCGIGVGAGVGIGCGGGVGIGIGGQGTAVTQVL